MKGFEFFKKQYDERHQVMVERINPQYPDGTYEFVHIAWQYFFGDAKADGWFRVNGIDDIEWMYEQKYMRKIERSSWVLGGPPERPAVLRSPDNKGPETSV